MRKAIKRHKYRDGNRGLSGKDFKKMWSKNIPIINYGHLKQIENVSKEIGATKKRQMDILELKSKIKSLY